MSKFLFEVMALMIMLLLAFSGVSLKTLDLMELLVFNFIIDIFGSMYLYFSFVQPLSLSLFYMALLMTGSFLIMSFMSMMKNDFI